MAVTLPASTGVRTVQASASLDTGRLEFGLANAPAGNPPADLSWMTGSGVPWHYRYQYLAGGVGNASWWESSSFAQSYMTESTTGPANYLPVLTVYMICQSSPACAADNQSADYTNLQSSSIMAGYYADMRHLLQQAAAYGKPVIIHVEPDLWGMMELQAANVLHVGNSAVNIPAKVKSSGFTDAHVNFSAFNDDLQSFACSLLKLRDYYAPNALMAIHASPWSGGLDIAGDTTVANPVPNADNAAAFLNSSCLAGNPFGGSTWDLVFNDVNDHDAAWWELVCGCTNSFFTHWWDPRNINLPNFTRYLGWVTELKLKTLRPQIVWQVPVGNQWFETMDNSTGHFQDTIAQYFLKDHPDQLYAAGLIGVMFGAGNAGQTSYADSLADGVTNGPGHATLDAATTAWCSSCNTHVSSSSDDDGGFIRTFGALYYATHPLTGRQPVSQAASHSPQPRGGGGVHPDSSASPGSRGANPKVPATGGGSVPAAPSLPPALSTQLYFRVSITLR